MSDADRSQVVEEARANLARWEYEARREPLSVATTVVLLIRQLEQVEAELREEREWRRWLQVSELAEHELREQVEAEKERAERRARGFKTRLEEAEAESASRYRMLMLKTDEATRYREGLERYENEAPDWLKPIARAALHPKERDDG
jgi:hypothetical protein